MCISRGELQIIIRKYEKWRKQTITYVKSMKTEEYTRLQFAVFFFVEVVR